MLLEILKQYGNPMEKVYNVETGCVAAPMSQDAGEIKYLLVNYSCGKWRPSRQLCRLPEGYWRPCVGVDEAGLVKISEHHWMNTE